MGRLDFQGPRDRSAILFGAAVATAIAVAACNNTSSDNGLVMPYGVPVPQPMDAGPPTPQPQPSAASTLDAGPASNPANDVPHHPIVQPYGVPMPHPYPTPSASTNATPDPMNMPVAPAYGGPPPHLPPTKQ